MKAPDWAPADLVERRQELEAKAREEKSRFEARGVRRATKEEALDDCRFFGSTFVGHQEQFRILDALTVHSEMESVWKNLKRREHTFQPDLRCLFPHGGRTQSRNLYGACLRATEDWHDVSKLTRSEHRELHEKIAQKSLELVELLLQTTSSHLLDTVTYMDDERRREFIEGLIDDGHNTWRGFDFYFDHLLERYLKTIPGLLFELHRRAIEAKEAPLCVPQPRADDARAHFFIRQMSSYFVQCYGQPLHAHVATITRVVLKTDDDEDSVRALIRADRLALRKKTRKKVDQMREEIDGE